MLNWAKKSSSRDERTGSPKKSSVFSLLAYGRKITMSFSSISKLNESVDSTVGVERNEDKKNDTSSCEGDKVSLNLRSSLKKPRSTDGMEVMDNLEGSREKRVSFLEVVEHTRNEKNTSERECKKIGRIFSFGKKDTTSWRGRKLSEQRVKRKLETSRDSGWESMSSLSSSSSSLISDDSIVIRSSSPLTDIVCSQEDGDSSDGKKQRRQLTEFASRKKTMMKYINEKSRAWAETFRAIIPSRRATTTTAAAAAAAKKGRRKNKGRIVSVDRLGSKKGRKVSFSTDTKIYDCDARLVDDHCEPKDTNPADEVYENGAIDASNLDESSENLSDVTTESSIGTMLFGASLNHHRSLDHLYKFFQKEKRATSISDSRLYVREGTAKLLPGCCPAVAIQIRSFPVYSSRSRKDNERDERLVSPSLPSVEDAPLSSTNFDNFLASPNEKYHKICKSDSELYLKKTATAMILLDFAKMKHQTTSDPGIDFVESTQPTSAFKRCRSLRFRRQLISKSADELRTDGDGEDDDDYDDVAEFNSLQDLSHVPASLEKLDIPELCEERRALSSFEGDARKEDEHSIIRESTRKRRYKENFEEREVSVTLGKEENTDDDKGSTDSHDTSFIVTMYV